MSLTHRNEARINYVSVSIVHHLLSLYGILLFALAHLINLRH